MPRMYCSLVGLLYSPYHTPACLDVPTFAARYLHVHNDARDPSSERWNYVGENWPVILPEIATSTSIQGSFTSRKSPTWNPWLYFPSEGRCAEDFFRPEKSWRLRPGLNPRTWALKGLRNLSYPACKTHAPYCSLWPAGLYRIFPHYLIKGTIFRRKETIE